MADDKIHGIVLVPSQQAQDLLAAFHLGAQTVLAALAPNQIRQTGNMEQVNIQGLNSPPEDEISSDISLQDLAGMDPLRRESLLSAFGLTVAPPYRAEADPTAHNLKIMLEEDGIATAPGPGGAIARQYQDAEDEEGDE